MSLVARLKALRRSLADRAGSELSGLGGDSLYAAIWQASTSIADLAQIALITHVLGLDELGRLAIAISFVMLVGQFFDVRVGVATTTMGARELRRDPNRATGLFQLSYLIDAVTGVAAFLIVCGLAPLAGPGLIGTDGTLLIVLYAATLLTGTVEESSLTILRLLDRYRTVAFFTVALEVARVLLIVAALLLFDNLVAVMVVLIAHRALFAAIQFAFAARASHTATGRSLFGGSALDEVRDLRRRMLKTVFQTNLVSYGRLTQTQLPTVIVGAIAGTTQAGAYKLGSAAAVMVGRLADPAYLGLLPRLSRLVAAGDISAVRDLVRRMTYVSVPVMGIALLLLIVFRDPVLALLGGEGQSEAAEVLVLCAVAFAINAAVFWNVGVLFAVGRAGVMARVAVVVAMSQVVLLVPLVEHSGATGAALALLLTMTGANIAMTWLAVAHLRRGICRVEP